MPSLRQCCGRLSRTTWASTIQASRLSFGTSPTKNAVRPLLSKRLPHRVPMDKLLPSFLTRAGASGSKQESISTSSATNGKEAVDNSAGLQPGKLSQQQHGQQHTSQSSPGGGSKASVTAGQRNYMEDRHTIIPAFDVGGKDDISRQFLAVYDGHSSHQGSEHASKRMHEIIAAQEAVRLCQGEPRSRGESDAMEEALKAAFVSADQEILDTAVRGGNRYGTTAVCALRVGRVVYVAHAGDSRAVLCRDGRAVSLTKDHKPTNPEEAQRIEAQGGKVDYITNRVQSNSGGLRLSKLNMSRALGDPDFKGPRRLVESEPDVARVVLKPGRDSFILLGSDGLFDVMTNQEAVDVVNDLLVREVKALTPQMRLLGQQPQCW